MAEIPADKGMSSELESQFPNWGEQYMEAMTEHDDSKLLQKIDYANAVMSERIRELNERLRSIDGANAVISEQLRSIDNAIAAILQSHDEIDHELAEIQKAAVNLALLLDESGTELTDSCL